MIREQHNLGLREAWSNDSPRNLVSGASTRNNRRRLTREIDANSTSSTRENRKSDTRLLPVIAVSTAETRGGKIRRRNLRAFRLADSLEFVKHADGDRTREVLRTGL